MSSSVYYCSLKSKSNSSQNSMHEQKHVSSVFGKFENLRKLLIPVTLSDTDFHGRAFQLWKYKNVLVASIQDENGEISILSGEKVHNALQPQESSKYLLERLERVGLKKWKFAYLEETKEIYLWPNLIAAGKNTEPKSITQTKIDGQKGHIKYSDLNAARREAKGEIVARKPDGRPYDHITEVESAQNGLFKAINLINKRINNPNTSPKERARLEKELSEASKLLDRSEQFLPRPSMKNFKESVQQNHLSDTYNSSHPDHPIAQKGASGGSIGGVGNEVGIIEGLFDKYNELEETHHYFYIPSSDGEKPFKDKELQQILRELAIGIFRYDTVPFVSLHFNGKHKRIH